VLFERYWARGCLIFGVEKDEMMPFCEALGEVSEDLSKKLAVAALRAYKVSDKNPLFCVRHGKKIPWK
jgi:hypothetical protein